jgi:protein involved in polysaccharide export with SLBB domain
MSGPLFHRASSTATALRAVATALVLLGTALPAAAQTPRASAAAGNYSRAEIEAAAQAAEREAGSDAGKRAEAAQLRARLRDGDFAPGDRVVLEVRGDSALFDTLTVRSGPSLRLPNMPDLPLQGVLRSELPDHLTRFLSRYIRQPDVRVESLIRVSMLGQVIRPGFYDFNSDMLLTDAIMAAGGPTSNAALERSAVRRGKDVVLAKERVRRAAQSGATLDRLGLRPGDEITIGEKRPRINLQTVLGIVGAVTSLAFTALWLTRQ